MVLGEFKLLGRYYQMGPRQSIAAIAEDFLLLVIIISFNNNIIYG